MEEKELEEIYRNILALVKEFCNQKPYPGFEVTYLENAEEVFEIYKTAGRLLDELSNTSLSMVEEKSLIERLKAQQGALKKLVN